MPYAVTRQMIDSFAELIFELSLNKQSRYGDPVRKLDYDAIAAQREGTGLSDSEIAAKLGLGQPQVTYIRNVVERRLFSRREYRKLFALGGSKRYRGEHHRDPAEQFALRAGALRLRQTLSFDPERVRTYYDQGWWRNETLRDWTDRAAGSNPDRAAILCGQDKVSYGELKDRAAALADGLWQLGLRRGDVVALQLPNELVYLVSYLAIAAIGAVVQTVPAASRAPELAGYMDHSKARAIISSETGADAADLNSIVALSRNSDTLEWVISTRAPCQDAILLDQVVKSGTGSPHPVKPVGADVLLLLYTAGTTSSPKAVPLTNHMVLGNARMTAEDLEFGEDDVIVSVVPLSHHLGLMGFHLALAAGGTTVLCPEFSTAGLAGLVAAHGVSGLILAPGHVIALLKDDTFDWRKLSPLKRVIISGGLCLPDSLRALGGKLESARLVQMWSMTEVLCGAFTRPNDLLDTAATTAGGPARGLELRILTTAGEACGPGREGELQVRGSSVIPGYLDNPIANGESFTEDGWFRTGDAASLDRNGNLRLAGRIRDRLSRGEMA